MSPIPNEIPDVGSAQVAPRQNPEFSPGPGFTTEDYYVWSRLDGTTTLREVILMVGLGAQRTIDILRKLRREGALLLPGETPATVPRAPAPAPPPAEAAQTPEPAASDAGGLGSLTDAEQRAMDEAVELTASEKRRIIQMMRVVAGGDYFRVLGVDRSAGRRELKRAYFRLSKEFHPDRYYKHELGSFGAQLSRIFESAAAAFQLLSDAPRRAAYVESLDQGKSHRGALRAVTQSGATTAQAGQTKADYAVDIFGRACNREVAGDMSEALRLFTAAVQLDPQPRYFRRSARCALAAGQLSIAKKYAKKAADLRPDNPSYARLLADAHRAAGELDQAERILVNALRISTASDILAREIEADLVAVRAAREEV